MAIVADPRTLEPPNLTADTEVTPTRRVVLKREDVIVLPEGTTVEELLTADKATLQSFLSTHLTKAWVVASEQTGTKDGAIEAHAGKAGTPDAKPGEYRSVTTRAWSGGLVYERPEAPKVEKRRLED